MSQPVFSMTGFANAQVRESDAISYTLSLKSVNHRFLDLHMRMPSGYDALEISLRKLLKEQLIRGHVELTLSFDKSAQPRTGYNRELVANYVAAFAQAKSEHHLSGEPDLNAILRLPAAFQAEQRATEDNGAQIAESVERTTAQLIAALKQMRAREGESLVAVLRETMDRLEAAANGVAALRPEVEARAKERLSERLLAAVGAEFNKQRVLEEIAILVERSDVSEEIARLHTHVGHFRELLAAGGEIGKKLDFLLQELNREANTLLSKTAGVAGKGTEITSLGLAMKAEIEKAREQIQNLE